MLSKWESFVQLQGVYTGAEAARLGVELLEAGEQVQEAL